MPNVHTPEVMSEIVKDVALKTRDHARQFTTPISLEVDPDWGELVGSGSYINEGDQHYLITNKHVMDDFCDRCGGDHFR